MEEIALEDLLRKRKRMDERLQELQSRSFPSQDTSAQKVEPDFDMFVKNDELHLEVELPGLDPSEMVVELNPPQLILSGRLPMESEVPNQDYLVRKRRYGPFNLKFSLPSNKETKVHAAYSANGVYHLILKQQDLQETKHLIEYNQTESDAQNS